jgi:hypothetical protein
VVGLVHGLYMPAAAEAAAATVAQQQAGRGGRRLAGLRADVRRTQQELTQLLAVGHTPGLGNIAPSALEAASTRLRRARARLAAARQHEAAAAAAAVDD